MNREWSELNKAMQEKLRRESTFAEGLDDLFTLRKQLMEMLDSFETELSREDFSAMPFPNAKGYHCKTIAYSIWHIFRIEDIVAHTLIRGDEQVFFGGNYQKRMGAPIMTTGNELVGSEIAEFSEKLNLQELYSYIKEVKDSTEKIIRELPYGGLKKKIPGERKEALLALGAVSTDESAAWLVDYWCRKDIEGLIRMPLSRHWIMHTEACLRIKSGLK
ncbi:MAG: phage head-tail adapter protein [Acutalibacter sp.]|nr:phage head-tail adapter protein [Acutalibacter sp.]